MKFLYTKQHVKNRGEPPDSFLEQLVKWGRSAPEELFRPNTVTDVYSYVRPDLGPWETILHRRAAMLEVMRVLAGFESSWNWNEGRDITNLTSVTPDTIEAGAWQVSANSMAFGQDLVDLIERVVGTRNGDAFQAAMKANHELAMEYIARLLRHTVRHNGPVARREINPWLSRSAVKEFEQLLVSAVSDT